MNFYMLFDQSLSVGPLNALLLVCVVFFIGGIIGRYVRRRSEEHAERVAELRVGPVPASSSEIASCSIIEAAVLERTYSEGERIVPREWDGERPRPNLNRRSG